MAKSQGLYDGTLDFNEHRDSHHRRELTHALRLADIDDLEDTEEEEDDDLDDDDDEDEDEDEDDVDE